MKAWLDIMTRVAQRGVVRPDRTGVGTKALFGEQLRVYNRPDSFPAVTAKKLAWGPMVGELAAFLRGRDSLAGFHEFGCHIWDGNGNADYWKPRAQYDGHLGRIYGVQWRDWHSVPASYHGAAAPECVPERTDQLRNLVDGIKRDPYGRRHLMTAWNPGELDQMCLPPCHVLFQCFVSPRIETGGDSDHYLDVRVDMRSVDLFLGLPFDIASYAVLQRLIAHECGLESRELVFQLGDAHVYLNHMDQVCEAVARGPLAPPVLELAAGTDLFNFDPSMAVLRNYVSHPHIAAPLNV